MIGPLLDHGAGLDARDRYGRTALTLAAGAGHLSVIKALVKRGAGLTGGLYAAARSTHVPVAKYLITQGAALDEVSQDEFEMTPLMAACSTGKKKGSAIALLLLQAGAGVGYVRHSDGMSALKFALGECSEDVVLELNVAALRPSNRNSGRSGLHEPSLLRWPISATSCRSPLSALPNLKLPEREGV
jgi:ankyrin repeat protein